MPVPLRPMAVQWGALGAVVAGAAVVGGTVATTWSHRQLQSSAAESYVHRWNTFVEAWQPMLFGLSAHRGSTFSALGPCTSAPSAAFDVWYTRTLKWSPWTSFAHSTCWHVVEALATAAVRRSVRLMRLVMVENSKGTK